MPASPKEISLPFYLKYTLIMLGLVALFFVLYIGKSIIVPLIFSTIVAIVLNPLVNWLTGKKIHRVLSIALALLAAAIVTAGITWVIVWQAGRFADSIPEFKSRLNVLIAELVNWSADKLNLEPNRINGWIAGLRTEIGKNTSTMVGQTLSTVGGVFVFVVLLPIYVFTILYYKPLLLMFVSRVFPLGSHKTVAEVMVQSKSLIQSYLIGLLIEAVIVATLNSVGLLIIGVKYAILLGLISALLNLIPYIGIVIATAMPMLLALTTQSPMAALWVFLLYLAVQFIDNQYIVPYIVASKVKVNALASIVVVLVAGALWGISGMFLAIPLTAILKVIFDHIEPMQPFGLLLGDDMPDKNTKMLLFAKRKKTLKPQTTK